MQRYRIVRIQHRGNGECGSGFRFCDACDTFMPWNRVISFKRVHSYPQWRGTRVLSTSFVDKVGALACAARFV